MQILSNILLGVALVVAILFTLIVLLTGKGDAMSGGSSVRTTFKGKAGFDDYMSRVIIILAASFMVLMIVLDRLSEIIGRS
ncbi:MAG: preprotein translocase subunit SecG [Fimbriimonadaceae bacterium]